MLSVIIVAYRPDKVKLRKILKKIGKQTKIIIINNCKEYNLNDIKFSKKTKIIRSKNYGNGAGINLGLKNCKTKLALYLDIDVEFKNNFIQKFINYSKKVKDFSVLIPNHGNLNSKKKRIEKYEGEASVMLFNIKKFRKTKIFDENYFLYFEELDLFYNCKKMGLKTYFVTHLNIKHLRASSISDNVHKISNLRSWHYMWSMFFYYKKNFSYFMAVKKTFFLIIKDFLMLLIYLIIFNKFKFQNRFYRLFGILSCMLGLKSYLRP